MVEHLPDTEGVTGSNPVSRTILISNELRLDADGKQGVWERKWEQFPQFPPWNLPLQLSGKSAGAVMERPAVAWACFALGRKRKAPRPARWQGGAVVAWPVLRVPLWFPLGRLRAATFDLLPVARDQGSQGRQLPRQVSAWRCLRRRLLTACCRGRWLSGRPAFRCPPTRQIPWRSA